MNAQRLDVLQINREGQKFVARARSHGVTATADTPNEAARTAALRLPTVNADARNGGAVSVDVNHQWLNTPEGDLDRTIRTPDGAFVQRVAAGSGSSCIVRLEPDGTAIAWTNENFNDLVVSDHDDLKRLLHHDADVEGIVENAATPPSDAAGTPDLEDIFEGRINPNLEDPFLVDGSPPPGDPFHFVSGSEPDLRKELRRALFADPEVRDAQHVRVSAAAGEGVAEAVIETDQRIVYDGGFLGANVLLLQATIHAVDNALKRNAFTGTEYEYNDGAHDRLSGWSELPVSLVLDLDRPSAHEMARLAHEDDGGDTA